MTRADCGADECDFARGREARQFALPVRFSFSYFSVKRKGRIIRSDYYARVLSYLMDRAVPFLSRVRVCSFRCESVF